MSEKVTIGWLRSTHKISREVEIVEGSRDPAYIYCDKSAVNFTFRRLCAVCGIKTYKVIAIVESFSNWNHPPTDNGLNEDIEKAWRAVMECGNLDCGMVK